MRAFRVRVWVRPSGISGTSRCAEADDVEVIDPYTGPPQVTCHGTTQYAVVKYTLAAGQTEPALSPEQLADLAAADVWQKE